MTTDIAMDVPRPPSPRPGAAPAGCRSIIGVVLVIALGTWGVRR